MVNENEHVIRKIGMKNQTKAYWYAGFTILFWSTVATAFKLALETMQVLQIIFLSTIMSFFILVILNVLNGNIRKTRQLSLNDCISSAMQGLINPILYYWIIFKAYSLLPAQVAQPVNMIWPLVLVFFSSLVLKQKIPYSSYLAMLISLCGVYFIAGQGSMFGKINVSMTGLIFAGSSSLVWSAYWVMNMKSKVDEIIKLMLNFFFAAIYIFVICLLFKVDLTFTKKEIFFGLYIGLFEMGLGFAFWIKALKLSVSADKVSNLIFIIPFMSLIFIYFILHEKIYYTTFVGAIFIVLGIYYEKRSKKGSLR